MLSYYKEKYLQEANECMISDIPLTSQVFEDRNDMAIDVIRFDEDNRKIKINDSRPFTVTPLDDNLNEVKREYNSDKSGGDELVNSVGKSIKMLESEYLDKYDNPERNLFNIAVTASDRTAQEILDMALFTYNQNGDGDSTDAVRHYYLTQMPLL